MHFKSAWAAAWLLALTACGFVHDEPKEAHSFQSKTLDLTCLQKTPTQVQKLFNGEYTASRADREDAREIWACVDHALLTFSSYTHGGDPNSYSAQELQDFGNRYLPAGQQLNDAFVRSIFKLKTTIIGGSENSISRPELVSLRSKLNRFGQVIDPLVPHIGTLLIRSNASAEEKKVAGSALEQFVLGLASVLQDSSGPVAWEDLKSFLFELDHYITKQKTNSLTIAREQIDVLKWVKLLVVGGSETGIEKEKWTSIFQAVSNAYSAIFLSATPRAMLEELSIEVTASDGEQKKAVEQINATLLRMKADKRLASHDLVLEMSDRFAKIQLANSFLFPQYRGSLALKPFLSNAPLRKQAATLVDEITRAQTGSISTAKLTDITVLLMNFLDQASLASAPTGSHPSAVSLAQMQDDLKRLSPLFTVPSDKTLIQEGLETLVLVIPMLTNQSTDTLTPKNLRQIIQKSLDLYLAWQPGRNSNQNELIGASLDILLRAPALVSASKTQLLSAVSEIKTILGLLKVKDPVNWSQVNRFIQNGFALKSALLIHNDRVITNAEISQLSYLWSAFRKDGITPATVLDLSARLKSQNLASARIASLIPLVDAFLPTGQGIAHFGLNARLLGDLKVLLVSGSRDTVASSEYPELARSAALLYQDLSPKLEALPKKFEVGFNALTVDLAAAFIRGFVRARRTDISLSDLKSLILDVSNSEKARVRPRTVDLLLTGLYTRLFNHSKGQKPSSISGLTLKPDQLNVFLPLLELIEPALNDVERAFANLDFDRDTLTRANLLGRLKVASNRTVVSKIQPLLYGASHLLHFPSQAEVRDRFYEYDVAYKTTMFNLLNWVMPYYKIAADPAAGQLRLGLTDLQDLLTDINDLVFDLRLSLGNSPPPQAAAARMQNMNLFTQVGNGDQYMDPLEGTEFLTITAGGKVLLHKIESELFPRCVPGVTDYDSVTSISIACISKVFFSKSYLQDVYGPVVPQLLEQYLKFNATQLETYRKSALTATVPGWTEGGMLDLGDFENLISLPYFLENVFERFDHDRDQVLRFSELMTAFPVFCQEIARAGAGKLSGSCRTGEAPKQIEAVYGYLIFNGHPPTGTEPGNTIWTRIKANAEMLVWFGRWSILNRDPHVRDTQEPLIGREELLSIISNLALSTAQAGAPRAAVPALSQPE